MSGAHSQRIVVIGAGFGGLAAAIRLAARGHDVTLLEQRDQPGGRAYVYRQDGFTFDGGPTVITAPWLLDDLFALAGRRREDAVTLTAIDPYYRIFFPDGVHFDYTGETPRMVAEMRRLGASDADIAGYHAFVTQSARIFETGFTGLATEPFLRWQDMARVAPDLLRLESYRTVYGLVSQYVQHDRLRQILSFHPLLVGGNPFQTTSIYALIHHLEREWGVWYAQGGTGAVVDALVELFRDLGGTLRLNSRVGEILIERGEARGVRLTSGEVIPADSVVCNADVSGAYETLLPPAMRRSLPGRWLERMRHSMSLVVIYFGTDRQYRGGDGPALAHHDIILGPRYRDLLHDIFRRGRLSDDLSLYLHMPTLTDPSLAPPGCEAFYVLAPVPHLRSGIDWAREAGPFRDRVMGFLERYYLPDLSRHLVTEHMIDPRHFRDTLSSSFGAAFSVEPILTQSAWFRPHNRAPGVPNLYFVGAGTHPGAGLPGVLCSAVIADRLIAGEVG
ncbi:MAG: phytoene desaturase family protein [Thermomicrobiales bacterium]